MTLQNLFIPACKEDLQAMIAGDTVKEVGVYGKEFYITDTTEGNFVILSQMSGTNITEKTYEKNPFCLDMNDKIRLNPFVDTIKKEEYWAGIAGDNYIRFGIRKRKMEAVGFKFKSTWRVPK